MPTMMTSHFSEEIEDVGEAKPLLHAVRPDEPFEVTFEKRPEDVMIDIETMSLHPHKALILSIGMIEFSPSTEKAPYIGERSRLVLDIASQLLIGRHVDAGTQEFWGKQSRDAAEHWLVPEVTVDPDEAIQQVKEFCADRKRVWANGTQFDLSNLVGLGADYGIRDLWHYRAPCDMRTFVNNTPVLRFVPDLPANLAHEPISDCVSQVWQVWAHWQGGET